MKIRVQEGLHAGQTLDLPAHGLMIGRDPHCDLVLDLDGVSRRHARIVLEHGVYVIEDLGSTNGVRVNGQRITNSKPLLLGDKIGISSTVLLLTDAQHIADEAKLEKLAQATAAAPPPSVAAVDSPSSAPQSSGKAAGIIFGSIILALIVGSLVWLAMGPGGAKEPETGADSETMADYGDYPKESGPRPVGAIPSKKGPAATKAPEAKERLLYYQVISEPPGAEVVLENRTVGVTPLIMTHLQKGSYEITLNMPGYQTLSRFFYVPTDGAPSVYEMRQLKGTCRLTSEPSGAAVYHGSQLLGTTPLVIDTLAPGTHPLRITAPGYAQAVQFIKIVDYLASKEHVQLVREMGELLVTTFPAGAQVVVDGFPMGTTEAISPRSYESAELQLEGLSAGNHRVYMTLHGIKSEPQALKIDKNEAIRRRLVLWLPNATIRLTNNREVKGMLREELPNGDVELLINPTRLIRVKAEQIAGVDVVPLDEFVRQHNEQAAPGGR